MTRRLEIDTESPKALKIVQESLSHLTHYLETELTTKSMRDSNLISGCLGREILNPADRESVPLKQIWSAMLESAILDQKLRFTKFRLSTQTSFAEALWRYLQERDDSASIETLKRRRWNELAADISEEKLRRNVQWLADWIEADIAYAAFALKRANRKTFSDNPIRNLAATIITWLRSSTMSERSQRHRWQDELDELGAIHKQDFPDRLEEVTDGLRSADNLPANPTTRLEEWLFRIWPLVIHHEWTKPEIVACVPAQWDNQNQFSERPDYFLRCRGLRGGAQDGGRGVPRSRPHPPRETLAKSWLVNLL